MYVLLIETNEYQPENGEWFLELAGTRPAAKKMWERRKIKKEAFESAAAHVIWLLQPTIYRSSSGWYTQSAMFKLKKVIKIFIDGLNVGIFAAISLKIWQSLSDFYLTTLWWREILKMFLVLLQLLKFDIFKIILLFLGLLLPIWNCGMNNSIILEKKNSKTYL